MPELPEVETVVRCLQSRVVGATLVSLTVRRRDLRIFLPQDLKEVFTNHKIASVQRRAKYILVNFSHGQSMIVHLGMSGRLFFTRKNHPLDKHDHVLFDFDTRDHLRLRDPRRFGLLTSCATAGLSEHKLIRHLGVEPLDKEFNTDYLYKIFCNSTAPVKNIIMNAKNVVGVGNIYASEALFLCGIHPESRGNTLKQEQVGALVKSIKSVLHASIKKGGTSIRDYVDGNGNPGFHQLNLNVYQRAGQPCRICKTPVRRIMQSNRSSFFCRHCQKLRVATDKS